jgi:hypothetical protein
MIRELTESQQRDIQKINEATQRKIEPLSLKKTQAEARAAGAAEARRMLNNLWSFEQHITKGDIEQAREVLRRADENQVIDFAPYYSE